MSRDITELRARLERDAGGCHHGGPITVAELCRRFIAHGRQRWDPRPGCPNNEVRNAEYALAPMLELYGRYSADDMSSTQITVVQLYLVESTRLCAYTINRRIALIRRAFRWGVRRALVAAETLTAIEAVECVRPPQASLPAPVEAVPVEDVEATLPFLRPRTALMSNPVETMVRLSLLTGMRPGEVVAMTADSIERASTVWTYRVSSHKTSWRAQQRTVALGPRAQALLTRLMLRHPSGPLFRTRLGGPFRVGSYSQAVRRAAIAAVAAGAIEKRWHVSQLRHTAAQMAARDSLQTAQHLLGHADPRVTQVYLRGSTLATEYAAAHG